MSGDRDESDHTIEDGDETAEPARAAAVPLGPRYQERASLGSGGMGEVLLVHDTRIGRDVALKRLKRDGVQARHRFAREARLQGRLEHPAIVPVYDLESGGDAPFFTMKRVRGASLRAILAGERERFSRRRLLSALSQVCLAVQYAHERGVVHRDIKPENVMLGDYGEVYLLDWGIAKLAAEPDTAPEHLDTEVRTRAGEMVGTLRYMAPEQVRSEIGAIDARTDVYALGAILFELLTGERLHEPGSLEMMVARIAAGVDARAHLRAPGADVPPELEAVCVEATRRDPRDRLPSARALHEAIERYLDGDRDAELRQKGARDHAELARTAAARALESSSTSEEESARRAEALKQVGQALALDPANREARRTLVELLTTPPRLLPPEVQRNQTATLRNHIRRAATLGALVYLYVLGNVLFMYPHSIKSWAGFLPSQLFWLGGLIAAVVTAYRPRYSGLFAMLLFGTAASVESTRILSPLLVVPGLLAAHAVIFSLFNDLRHRLAAVAIVSVGWTVSAFGALFGLFPKTVLPMRGGLFLDSPVVELAHIFTAPMTWVMFLAMIVLPAIIVGAMRSAYGKADLQLRLQSWQLGQLVPDGQLQKPTPSPTIP